MRPWGRAVRFAAALTAMLAAVSAGSGCSAATGGMATGSIGSSTTANTTNANTTTVAGSAVAGSTVAPGGSSVPRPAVVLPPASTTAAPGLRPVEAPTCAIPVAATAETSGHLAPPVAVTEPPAPPDTVSSTTTTTVPANAQAALGLLRNDPRVAGNTVSVSVWIDGLGEVASQNPDAALVPASNQKLLTAMGALRLLDPQERLRTELFTTGPVVDGVLEGDLVIVGGGDPTVTLGGDHGLEAFTRAAVAAGIRRVDGRVLVDDSRYDDVRRGQAWPDDWATYAGSMSALVADRNRYRQDAAFLADPALGHGEVFRFSLTAAGIAVAGDVGHTVLTQGVRLASLDSPTITELVTIMMFRSDNLIAELLVKEIGFRATHRPGSTAAGLAAIRQLTQSLCLVGALTGIDADGSGLSYDDRRSARELRRLLLAALLQPWGVEYLMTLSVAGTPDALGGRLVGPRTSGNVRAKGGSLAVSRSLSGYLTTASGRHAVFSIILNGPRVGRAEEAIDEFVTNLASLVN